MEIRLVIFLAFTSVTVVTNALLIWFGYKAIANVASKFTRTVSDFQKSSVTKEWISSMHAASEQALAATEFAKQKVAESELILERAQVRYIVTLAKVDSRLEEVGEKLTNGARQVRDTVAKPAFAIMSVVAGVSRGFNAMAADEEKR